MSRAKGKLLSPVFRKLCWLFQMEIQHMFNTRAQVALQQLEGGFDDAGATTASATAAATAAAASAAAAEVVLVQVRTLLQNDSACGLAERTAALRARTKQLDEEAQLLDDVLEAFATNTPLVKRSSACSAAPPNTGTGGGAAGGGGGGGGQLHLEPLGNVDTEAAWNEASAGPEACAAVVARLQQHLAALNFEKIRHLNTEHQNM